MRSAWDDYGYLLVPSINNEMWKCGGTLLHKAVVHMFNIILKYGVYPQKWKLSIVTPIQSQYVCYLISVYAYEMDLIGKLL